MAKALTKSVGTTKVSLVKAGLTGTLVTIVPFNSGLWVGGSDLSESGGAVSNGLNLPYQTPIQIPLTASEELFGLNPNGSYDYVLLTTNGVIV